MRLAWTLLCLNIAAGLAVLALTPREVHGFAEYSCCQTGMMGEPYCCFACCMTPAEGCATEADCRKN
jgi:hypothetical protein